MLTKEQLLMLIGRYNLKSRTISTLYGINEGDEFIRARSLRGLNILKAHGIVVEADNNVGSRIHGNGDDVKYIGTGHKIVMPRPTQEQRVVLVKQGLDSLDDVANHMQDILNDGAEIVSFQVFKVDRVIEKRTSATVTEPRLITDYNLLITVR